jgi:hypothetical protein
MPTKQSVRKYRHISQKLAPHACLLGALLVLAEQISGAKTMKKHTYHKKSKVYSDFAQAQSKNVHKYGDTLHMTMLINPDQR